MVLFASCALLFVTAAVAPLQIESRIIGPVMQDRDGETAFNTEAVGPSEKAVIKDLLLSDTEPLQGTGTSNFAGIIGSLRGYEELPFELVTRSRGENSLVDYDRNKGKDTYRLMRGQKLGSTVKKLIFYVVTEENEFILGVGVDFTDGTSDFEGLLQTTHPRKVHIVHIPQRRLEGLIAIEPRHGGNLVRINSVYFEDQNIQVATNDPSSWQNELTSRQYDVGGRFLTGVVVATDGDFRTLGFTVTKEVYSSTLTDINYDTASLPAIGKAKSLDTVTLSNDSNVVQSFSVSYTALKQSTISLFTEETKAMEHNWSIETGFAVEIPFIGETSVSAGVGGSYSSSYTSGKANENVKAQEISKEFSISVPSKTIMLVEITQFQEEVADLPFTATHRMEFLGGSTADFATEGVMKGLVVSNVLVTTKESALGM